MANKHIVLSDEENVSLLSEARIEFLKENKGVRSTDEAVVSAALKEYLYRRKVVK